MPIYRLNVQRYNKLFGHFESSTPWAKEAIEEISALLLKSDGYEVELLVANDERRLLETSSAGIKVLGREPIFTRIPFEQ